MPPDPQVATQARVPVRALAVELVRLRRATESFRAGIGVGASEGLEAGATSVLVCAVKLGPQRPSDLAKALGLDPSTLSRHVATLQRRDLVARVPCADDGRAHLVTATDAGHEAFARVMAHRDRILGALLADWSPVEVATLVTLLARLNDTVEGADLDSLLAGTVRQQRHDDPGGHP